MTKVNEGRLPVMLLRGLLEAVSRTVALRDRPPASLSLLQVYVEIEQGVGMEGGKILSEVELTPNITLESKTGTDAHVGVGLNWKWDY